MENFDTKVDSNEKPKNQELHKYYPEIQEYRELFQQTQESLEKTRAQVLGEKIGNNLKREFEWKGIPFDLNAFVKNFEQRVSTTLNQSWIPEIAKQKFLQDVEKRASNLGTVTLDDVQSLQTRRNIESFWIEFWELWKEFGNDESKKQAYYLQKILEETLWKYVDGASTWLEKAFSMQKETIWTIEYNRENTQELFSNLKQLDEKYWLQITEIVQKIWEKENLSQAQLYRRCWIIIAEKLGRWNKVPDTSRVIELIKNWVLNTRAKSILTEYDKDGKKEDIVDAVLAYKNIFSEFQWKENEAKWAKETALSDGFVSQAKDFIGMERLESDFTYIEPSNIGEKIKNMKFADAVIMLTQLVQLAPIVGDIWWGLDWLYTAYSGMNVSGEKISNFERTLNTIFWILGVSVIGGWIWKSLKAKQFWKVIETLKKIIPHLREKFQSLSSQLPEASRNQIAALLSTVSILWWEPAQAWVKVPQEAAFVKQMEGTKKVFSSQEKLENTSLIATEKFRKAENWRTKEGSILENIISNARLSDSKTEVLNIWGQIISVSPRMAKLYDEVKGFDEVKNMTPKQIEQMLGAIQSGHMLYPEVSIWQHSQRQIIEKRKEAKVGWAPDAVIRHALENGYMGTSALAVHDIRKVATWFNFTWVSEGVTQSIKSQIIDFIHISKNLEAEENQTRLLAMVSETSDVSLRNLLVWKETRNIRWEIEFPKDFLDSVDNIITYFKKNTSLHTVDISVLEKFRDQIQDGFYSAEVFANDFHEVLDTIRKWFSKKTEKVFLRSERLTAEVWLDTTRFPDFDKIMPPELIKAMNNLVDIYKQKWSTMTLADIPKDVKNALSFFSGWWLLKFIQTHWGWDLKALSVRINPTEVIKNMYTHLTNLQVEWWIIQRWDFNEELRVLSFQQLIGTFSFLAWK